MAVTTVAALGTVSFILDQLRPFVEREVKLHLNSREEAQRLTSHLKKIRHLLDAAEGTQLMNLEPDVEDLVEALQDVAQNMEDALEDYETAIGQPHVEEEEEEEEDHSLCKKVLNCLVQYSICCTNSFRQIVERRDLAQEINGLNALADSIYEKAGEELKLALTSQAVLIPKSEKAISTFLEDSVHGRTDKDTIMNMLFDCNIPRAGGNIDVVSIIGEGGIGKTTLAQLVYNDVQVGVEFEVRIWVGVSKAFEETRIAQEILEALLGGRAQINSTGMDLVARTIKENICQKPKFLLVLDDVWEYDHQKWKRMKGYLSSGAPGSKILVTTRNEQVATSLGATKSRMHRLLSLKYDACWSIIKEIALSGEDDTSCRRFEVVGKALARKCKGSPLAAQFLGGLLRDKEMVPEWQYIHDSHIWEQNVQQFLFRHFFLSYNELDPAVKHCFSFCAVFPRNTEIDVDRLIRIWMALGLLSGEGASNQAAEMEGKGRVYFDELAQRCFFQQLVRDEDEFGERVVRCRMHDLVHDFARFLAKRECLTIPQDVIGQQNVVVNHKATRHLYWATNNNVEVNEIDDQRDDDDDVDDYNHQPLHVILPSFNARRIRSLFYIQADLSDQQDLFLRLSRVRVLTLSGCGIESIPEEIGMLARLKYLDLSQNDKLEGLPGTICDLSNLQTLILEQCRSLMGLPQGISRLQDHLSNISLGDNPYRFLLRQGLEELTNLRTLSFFFVAKGCPNKLGCLQRLNQLGGMLTIVLEELDEEMDIVAEARNARLRQKKSIQTLVLEYDESSRMHKAMEALRPHPQLQSLTIRCGAQLPRWISSITYLRKLSINYKGEPSGCSSELPPLGQLRFLEKLWINWCGLESLNIDFFLGLRNNINGSSVFMDVAFPSLKELRFSYCHKWKQWKDISEEDSSAGIKVMPRLTTLEITYSPLLKELPRRLLKEALSSLKCLTLRSCPHLKQKYENGDEDDVFCRFLVVEM